MLPSCQGPIPKYRLVLNRGPTVLSQGEAGYSGWDYDFERYLTDLLRNLKIEGEGASITMSLSDGFPAGKVLEGFTERSEPGRWTPLLLAQALVDFKRRVGGDARIIATGGDFIELSLTKCEFGEPRDNEYRGNLCEVCRSVTGAVAWASGIADPEKLPIVSSTMADGAKACSFRIELA